jgi:hypothetical protein
MPSNMPQDVKEKLKDLEKKLKLKFQHVQKLESALERTVGMHKDKSNSVKQGVNESSPLNLGNVAALGPNNRLLQSILRVIRKLKIELHSDYLQLGQVNMAFSQSNGVLSRNSTLNIQDTPNHSKTNRYADTGFFDSMITKEG